MPAQPRVSSTEPGRVHTSVVDNVGWIVLDSPQKHNAMSLTMWRSLIEAVSRCETDSAVRCVVIRGEGDRAFCAGSDIDEKQNVSATQAEENADLVLAGQRAVRAFTKPAIAMISGYCLGGGLGIALGCDFRVAGAEAVFGIPAAKLGLSYYYAELKRLTDLLGPARAKQMIFTADRVGAERAFQIGLVDEVVATEALLHFVTDMAGRIAGNAPLSLAAAKYAIDTAMSDHPGRDIAGCDDRSRACLASDDYAEGRSAFKEKRTPVFRGR